MKMNKCRQMIIAAFFALAFVAASVQGVSAAAIGGQQAAVSNDSKLSEFGVHPGTLSPAFSPDVLDYTATVDADTTAIDVRAVPRASGGSIASVEGARTLKPGVNTVKVTCSAPDNSFTVYTITVTVGNADGTTGAANDTNGADSQTVNDADGTDSQTTNGTNSTGSQTANGTDSQAAGDVNGTDSQTAGDVNGTDGEMSDGTNGMQGQDAASNQTGNQGAAKKKKKASLLGAVAADGTVTLSGATYKLSSNFAYGTYSQDIPSSFGQGSLQIGSSQYQTLHCDANGIDLVYMENTDGKGSTGFYYYDEVQNAVERFKYTGIGDNFVVFISSARADVPEGFQKKTLKLPSEKKVVAYKNQSSADMQDFYLIYGINSDGSDGWYFYDNAQGTYMRYVPVGVPEENPELEGELEPSVSLDKYNLLNEKYTKLKSNMVKSVSCFVIGIILLIILFTAILLRGKDQDDDDDGVEKKSREQKVKKKLKKTRKQPEAVPKSSLAAGRQLGVKATKGETKTITKTFTANHREEAKWDTPPAPDLRPRIQSDYVQQPVMPPDMQQTGMQPSADMQRRASQQPVSMQQQTSQQPVSMQQRAGQQASARRSLLKKESTSGSEDSMKLAAEKMRQSVRRPVNSQSIAGNSQRLPETGLMDEESADAKSKMPQRKKRSIMDDDVDIIDLNDL